MLPVRDAMSTEALADTWGGILHAPAPLNHAHDTHGKPCAGCMRPRDTIEDLEACLDVGNMLVGDAAQECCAHGGVARCGRSCPRLGGMFRTAALGTVGQYKRRERAGDGGGCARLAQVVQQKLQRPVWLAVRLA